MLDPLMLHLRLSNRLIQEQVLMEDPFRRWVLYPERYHLNSSNSNNPLGCSKEGMLRVLQLFIVRRLLNLNRDMEFHHSLIVNGRPDLRNLNPNPNLNFVPSSEADACPTIEGTLFINLFGFLENESALRPI